MRKNLSPLGHTLLSRGCQRFYPRPLLPRTHSLDSWVPRVGVDLNDSCHGVLRITTPLYHLMLSLTGPTNPSCNPAYSQQVFGAHAKFIIGWGDELIPVFQGLSCFNTGSLKFCNPQSGAKPGQLIIVHKAQISPHSNSNQNRVTSVWTFSVHLDFCPSAPFHVTSCHSVSGVRLPCVTYLHFLLGSHCKKLVETTATKTRGDH